ncbi:MAG: aminotransferase class I/II-fold pyridoxal phosphate-dependent enzyme [Vicinamibacteria bacterium]|nr:aminotransferase class I/II-fold pyridoxal phosphate-dependent enzyme [Vicinamibacteria bacterium]
MNTLAATFDPEHCLNPALRGMGQSATVAINERSNRMRREGRTVYKMGLGQSPFPVPEPVVEALKAHASRKAYLEVPGLKELREAVAEYHQRAQGVPVSGNDVMVAPGSKELMFLLQIAFAGDLLIPTPAWVSYAPQARIAGRKVYMLKTSAQNGWRLRPEQLDELCRKYGERPRVLILNYPSNPTGMTLGGAELKSIAEAARRNNIVLLSDEIYGELHHEGAHESVARFYPEGTIISSGLSKWCGAGGWRLGTFAFPKTLHWLREAMTVLASETYTSTSAPIQYAAVRAFQGGTRIERYLWLARRILRAIGRRLFARLSAAGLHVERPDGAFYLFVDFGPFRETLLERGIADSRQLCEKLLEETGVAALPGADFGSPPEELTVRMAYVDFDGARALAAAETLPADAEIGDEFVLRYAADLVQAVENVAAWVKSPLEAPQSRSHPLEGPM